VNGWEVDTQLGPLERDNLNHCTTIPILSPEDININCLTGVFFSEYQMMCKVQKSRIAIVNCNMPLSEPVKVAIHT
jgi:hypothetical protein